MGEVTIHLDETEASQLIDAVRWSRENAEGKNLKRVARKMRRLEELVDDQVNGDA